MICLDEITRRSLHEKLQIMEAIWVELRNRVETCEIPKEHRELLDRRREHVAKGEIVLLNWEEVKHSIVTLGIA